MLPNDGYELRGVIRVGGIAGLSDGLCKRIAGGARKTRRVATVLGRAFYWQSLLETGAMASGSAIARAEGLDPSTVNELLRLTLLAPDIIEQLMAGRQPRRLTLMWFQRNPLPVDWHLLRLAR